MRIFSFFQICFEIKYTRVVIESPIQNFLWSENDTENFPSYISMRTIFNVFESLNSLHEKSKDYYLHHDPFCNFLNLFKFKVQCYELAKQKKRVKFEWLKSFNDFLKYLLEIMSHQMINCSFIFNLFQSLYYCIPFEHRAPSSLCNLDDIVCEEKKSFFCKNFYCQVIKNNNNFFFSSRLFPSL